VARNYGIGFCERIIIRLEAEEDKLFIETGYGFDMYSQHNMSLIEHKRLLKKFKKEASIGMIPSYDPSVHGTYSTYQMQIDMFTLQHYLES